ncbi:hypothetical protein WKR88_07610 [Trinickia caryophylli]|uniref:Transcriptional regulator n=2 Tax=Trinickia caryophylli TaxID=28094 RepID=A0A1X7EA68_TRICW|nr:hypothetical protein [Trinickia caryophylli]PMS13094.1 hypothetical protein C0Z17_06740 [Trinickia caryophylli]TRX15425.1 hypothetical protein FNF07_26235 [Trinickia caryophylli]WQE15761.1 hypothetical protein U0034_28425 [Trinickia caryophylli]SMF30363.1 hypothetical protein SAMN06295900_105114 [Trinickia caryophylli]GLU31998.1 hypothetical protein Busp01_18400 [Trinickia caryophylli]
MQILATRHYRGYAVSPSAHALPDGYFSSNLKLTRSGIAAHPAFYEFYSLGYFDNEADALGHSDRWAQDWIDTRG